MGALRFLMILFLAVPAKAQNSHGSFKITDLQFKRITQITSFFENSTIQPQYDYVENLNDGRGYTAGRIGFCTGTGDLILVVRSYCTSQNTTEKICNYLPRLEEINSVTNKIQASNADIRGLEGFESAWKAAAINPNFRQIQDRLLLELYFEPARALAEKMGINSVLGLGIFYDTLIQHGEGGNSDSLKGIISKTNSKLKLSRKNEVLWLKTFLKNRRHSLLNPVDHATQAAWSESVSRVDILLRILTKDKNFDLNSAVKLSDNLSTD